MSSVIAVWCRATGRSVFVTDLGGGGWDISAYVSTDRLYHGHLHLSDYSRRVFNHTGKPGVHVIGGGVDTSRFCQHPEARRDGPVLFVGRLLPHKGVDDLIRSVTPEIPLDVVGPAPHATFLRDLKLLAAGKNVKFSDVVTDSELVTAYQQACCVVLPSVYRTMYGQETAVPELLGQTLLEAMACGAPVICTTVASLPEIVKDGVTGLVVPPNNPAELRSAIQWLRNHPEAGAAMGTAGRDWVLRQFTWPAVVARCLEIYRGSPRGASSLAVQKANVRGILAHPD